jgi:hypothetical protein
MNKEAENQSTEEELSTADIIGDALDAAEIVTQEPEQNVDVTAKTEEEQEQEPEYEPRLAGYKAEQREVLKSLPSDVLKIIDGREQSFFDGIEKYKQKAELSERFNNILAPDAEIMQQFGYTPEAYVAKLTGVERQLRAQDPITRVRALQGIMQDYGIDQSWLTQVAFDPHAYALQNKVVQYETERQLSQASTQTAETEQIFQSIEEFAQTHEHFESVKTVMGKLLETGQATDLESAYAKAVRLDDNLFQNFQTKQFEELKKAENLKANQAAKAAKSAAVQVKGAPTKAPQTAPAKTEDAVRAAMDALGY